MPHALAGECGFAPELEPETRELIALPFALLRFHFERELAALEQSRPRRRKTAVRLMAANVRRLSHLVDSLVWLNKFTDTYLPPREPTVEDRDRGYRKIQKKIRRIVAKANAEKAAGEA